MKVDRIASTAFVVCVLTLLMHETTGTLSKKDRGKKKKTGVCVTLIQHYSINKSKKYNLNGSGD